MPGEAHPVELQAIELVALDHFANQRERVLSHLRSAVVETVRHPSAPALCRGLRVNDGVRVFEADLRGIPVVRVRRVVNIIHAHRDERFLARLLQPPEEHAERIEPTLKRRGQRFEPGGHSSHLGRVVQGARTRAQQIGRHVVRAVFHGLRDARLDVIRHRVAEDVAAVVVQEESSHDVFALVVRRHELRALLLPTRCQSIRQHSFEAAVPVPRVSLPVRAPAGG